MSDIPNPTDCTPEQLTALLRRVRADEFANCPRGAAYDGYRAKCERRARDKVLSVRNVYAEHWLSDEDALAISRGAITAEDIVNAGMPPGVPLLGEIVQVDDGTHLLMVGQAQRLAVQIAHEVSAVSGYTVTVRDGEGNVLAEAIAPQAATLDTILTAMEDRGVPTDNPQMQQIAAGAARLIDETRELAEQVLDVAEAGGGWAAEPGHDPE